MGPTVFAKNINDKHPLKEFLWLKPMLRLYFETILDSNHENDSIYEKIFDGETETHERKINFASRIDK